MCTVRENMEKMKARAQSVPSLCNGEHGKSSKCLDGRPSSTKRAHKHDGNSDG